MPSLSRQFRRGGERFFRLEPNLAGKHLSRFFTAPPVNSLSAGNLPKLRLEEGGQKKTNPTAQKIREKQDFADASIPPQLHFDEAMFLATTNPILPRSEEHTSELQSRENRVCR